MTRRLRVLFITPWYPSPQNPVNGIFVREHAKAVQLYNDVVVLHWAGHDRLINRALRLEKEHDPTLTEGIPTYRAWHRRLPIPGSSLAVYLWAAMQAVRSIESQNSRFDIVHAHVYSAGLPAAAVARWWRIPMVLTEHTSAFPRRLLSTQQIRIARLAMVQAKVVMPISLALQRSIEEHGIQAHFRVIPNAVDTAIFYPPAERLPEPDRKLQLLFVGSLTANKGIQDLLQALARLREQRDDWHLNIIGLGPLDHEYKTLAANLGIAASVSFLGGRTRQQVATTMRQTDLFVLPSHYETFSAVTAEALATGLPVLVTTCGGVVEFVTPEVGMLVSPGDPNALLRGLSHMLDRISEFSPVQISRYAQNRFCLANVGALIDAVYRSV